MTTIHKLGTYLGISLVSSFAFALAWVIVMTLTLPETDLAHGQMPFREPLVLPIMSMFATVSGIAAWPLYACLGWRLQPARIGVASGVATLAFILVATSLNARVGWLGAYPVLLISLIMCRITMKPGGQQPRPI